MQDLAYHGAAGRGAVGVIGHNGAGKSTLLRLLNGLLVPDAGSIEIEGSTAALIELGVPFSNVLTARENIETGALLQGIDRSKTSDLVQAVAEFAELTDVLDAPVSTFSTGMQMRLGYAIAAQLAPELLLVDEVIAVGDLAFQRKCIQHIHRYLSAGGALVLVSHDLGMIQALCQRCIVLAEGRLIEDSPVDQAILDHYLRSLRTVDQRRTPVVGPSATAGTDVDDQDVAEPDDREDDVELVLESVVAVGLDGGHLATGAPARIEVAVRSKGDERRVRCVIDILAATRQVCLARIRSDGEPVGATGAVITAALHDLPLFPGALYLDVRFHDADTGDELRTRSVPVPIEVLSSGTRLETLAQLPAH